MTLTPKDKLLVVITGPTSVGKTGLAIEIAEKLNTEIISADARQFYRELKIGSAMPDPSQLKAIPHHLIGHLSIKDYYNASMYEKHALAVLKSLFRKSDHAVLCGGSGLYIDTLCRGIDVMPDPEPFVRKKVQGVYREEGLAGLRQWLKKIDPEYYSEVDRENPKRMMRAVEVFLSAGTPYSSFRKRHYKERPFRIKRIILDRPREELYSRINHRTTQMIANGLIEEAVGLFRYRHMNALNTVGYKEIFCWLSNRWPLQLAVEKIRTNTRRYAKRQITWFKGYDDAAWFHPNEKNRILEYILDSAMPAG